MGTVKKKYRALVGLNVIQGGDKERRIEAGDVVTDLPATSLVWLLREGLVEEVPAASKEE